MVNVLVPGLYLSGRLSIISSPEPLGSQSELIAFQWIRRPLSVRHPSVRKSVFHNAQTSSSQKPLGRSKPNFMWSLLGKGETKVCINGPGHMTEMAAMPIYGKNPSKIFFSINRLADFHETWFVASGTPAHHILYK